VTNEVQNDPTIEEMDNADPVVQELVKKALPVSEDVGALIKLFSEQAEAHPPAKLDDMLEFLRKADPDVSNQAVHYLVGWCGSELAQLPQLGQGGSMISDTCGHVSALHGDARWDLHALG
jgi:hypothetical protein